MSITAAEHMRAAAPRKARAQASPPGAHQRYRHPRTRLLVAPERRDRQVAVDRPRESPVVAEWQEPGCADGGQSQDGSACRHAVDRDVATFQEVDVERRSGLVLEHVA